MLGLWRRGLVSAGLSVARRLPRACAALPSASPTNTLLQRAAPRALSIIALAKPVVSLGSCNLRAMVQQAAACQTIFQPVRGMRSLVGANRRNPSRGGHRMGGARCQPRKRTTYQKRKQNRKLKTHKGAAKRFKLRGNGDWVYTATGKKHLMAGKSRSRLTRKKLKKMIVTTKGFIRKLHKLMPYHKKRAIRRA